MLLSAHACTRRRFGDTSRSDARKSKVPLDQVLGNSADETIQFHSIGNFNLLQFHDSLFVFLLFWQQEGADGPMLNREGH